MAASDQWIPLESNPDVINKFIWRMGVSEEWAFTDVWGLDPDLLAMLPQPVVAILMLFPITDKHELYREQEETGLALNDASVYPDSLYYTKQTVGNACGTIALIHALANNKNLIDIGHGTLQAFLERTASMTPMERAKAMEDACDLKDSHRQSALEGQTEAPTAEDDVNLHFVCFVQVENTLYELDGRKKRPIPHGPSSTETFAQDAANVVQSFMERDPEQMQFTLMALAPNQMAD